MRTFRGKRGSSNHELVKRLPAARRPLNLIASVKLDCSLTLAFATAELFPRSSEHNFPVGGLRAI